MARSRSVSKRGLSHITAAELHKELRRRQRRVATLTRKRAALIRKLEALDHQISLSGGKHGSFPNGKVRRRARNEMNLIDALAATLKNKTMGVAEAAEAVLKSGFRTTSANFRTMVNIALLNKKRFKRVDRGQYRAV